MDTHVRETGLHVPRLRGQVSETEWRARVDLAAAYRLSVHYGMTATRQSGEGVRDKTLKH